MARDPLASGDFLDDLLRQMTHGNIYGGAPGDYDDGIGPYGSRPGEMQPAEPKSGWAKSPAYDVGKLINELLDRKK